MTGTLWPVLHKLSSLLPLKSKIRKAETAHKARLATLLRVEFESTCQSVEAALQQWVPEMPQLAAKQAGVSDIFHNALAYRHGAFVYLYRNIYKYTRNHVLVRTNVHLTLVHCYLTISNAGSMAALLWPLFVSSVDAREPSDQELAKHVFVTIERQQGMANISKAWRIVNEVWGRAAASSEGQEAEQDREECTDLWEVMSKEMGLGTVFG